MTATLIDGKALAARVRKQVAAEVTALAPPGLATVLVGDDPASAIYVRNKRAQCVEAGMRDIHRHLPEDITQDVAISEIDKLAADAEVTGILVQSPVPPHLDPAALIGRMPAGAAEMSKIVRIIEYAFDYRDAVSGTRVHIGGPNTPARARERPPIQPPGG